MKTRIFLFVLLLSAVTTQSFAQGRRGGNFTLLGTRNVDNRLDRDVIPVTFRDGYFSALRFVVTGAAVRVHKCTVHFENGGVQDYPMELVFRRNSASFRIDLPGNRRLIEKVIFWYDAQSLTGRNATVHLYGIR